LYIADVDRINYVLKTYDFTTHQEDIISNINHNFVYDGFDLYEVIIRNPVIGDPTTKVPSWRFWGWSCGSSYNSTRGCVRTCAYYVLGISYYYDSYLVNDLPGSNPKIDTSRDKC